MAHRIGLSGAINFTPSRVGLTLHIPCVKGQHTVDVDVEPATHPDFVAKRMLAKGWTIGSRLCCPEHSRQKKKAAPAPRKTTPQPAKTEDTEPMSTANTAPITTSDEARLAKRYRPGHSDANIAKVTGIAEVTVAKIRDEFFGPSAPPEPAEFTRLRDSIADLKAEISTLSLAWAAKAEKLTDLITNFNNVANGTSTTFAPPCIMPRPTCAYPWPRALPIWMNATSQYRVSVC